MRKQILRWDEKQTKDTLPAIRVESRPPDEKRNEQWVECRNFLPMTDAKSHLLGLMTEYPEEFVVAKLRRVIITGRVNR